MASPKHWGHHNTFLVMPPKDLNGNKFLHFLVSSLYFNVCLYAHLIDVYTIKANFYIEEINKKTYRIKQMYTNNARSLSLNLV